MDFILTGYYEPNILISLFCLRFCNNIFTDKDFLLKRFHIISIIALTFITLHVFDIFEYSSAVILCYIFGHLVRLNSKNINFFGFIFPLIYYFYVNSFVHFTFSPLLTFSYIFLTFAIMAKLEFKPYPMKKKLSSKIIYFFGKYAFQIYFLHYTMFLLISYLYF